MIEQWVARIFAPPLLGYVALVVRTIYAILVCRLLEGTIETIEIAITRSLESLARFPIGHHLYIPQQFVIRPSRDITSAKATQ